MRRLWFSLGLSALVGALLLLALNGLAFVGEVVAHGTWIDGDHPAGLLDHAEGERPRLKPGASLRGRHHRIRINSLGFRGPELEIPKPDSALRLWCLGGSTTFDRDAADDAATWPAQVGALLQDRLPGRTVEVLNAGIPGQRMEGSLADLQALGPLVQPDVVVIYHGPDDLRQALSAGGTPSPRGVGERLRQVWDPALLRWLRRVRASQGPLPGALPSRAVTGEALQRLREGLRALVREARRQGAVPVLATHALRAAPEAEGEGEGLGVQVAEASWLLGVDAQSTLKAFDDYNALVAEVAGREGVALADVRAAVPPGAEGWGDALHFRGLGASRAAAVIAGGGVGAVGAAPRAP